MLWQDQWLLFALIIYWRERFNITLHFLDLNIVEESLTLINQRLTLDEIIPQLYPNVEISRAISGTTLDHFRPLFLSKVCVKWSAQRVKSWCCIVILATFQGHLTQGQDIDVSLDARIQKTKYDVERKGRSQKGQELWNLLERSWQRLFGIPRRFVDRFSNSLGPQYPSCTILWCEGRTQKGNPKQKKGIFNNNTRPHANC